ncbi:hypothetical protein VB774_18805 [Pseudanabaena galeata UHCC 0370]|uniref:DUF4435 domain-containing protein n=1 Tax=Pseudanabaena galeata UHCC 0370 TaxID=3110310 RepID=A0ABU5TMV9_9CYAN|nr:hypothetical protein [Pseudanabaena galeata]MEA5479678.1 hypothetical protein [Pseudanabaena galeata UHCC 0370]
MDIQDYKLYVLLEGEPNSPEIEGFQMLLDDTDIIEFVEIGGSGSFNTITKLIYNKVKKRENHIHHTIPVLAIADRDFRNLSLENTQPDNELIAKNNPKKLFWERHEWENFLLDELDVLTSFLNELPPTELLDHRPSKKIAENIEKEAINIFLLQYFQSQVETEFIECLKFRFSENSKVYPKLIKPKDIKGIAGLRRWYESEITEQTDKSKNKIESCHSIFDEILEEYNWKNWIQDPRSLSLEDGKKFFRGKEAFQSLLNELTKKFKISNLNEKILKQRILKDLERRPESILVAQINKILLPYLQKAKEILE